MILYVIIITFYLLILTLSHHDVIIVTFFLNLNYLASRNLVFFIILFSITYYIILFPVLEMGFHATECQDHTYYVND